MTVEARVAVGVTNISRWAIVKVSVGVTNQHVTFPAWMRELLRVRSLVRGKVKRLGVTTRVRRVSGVSAGLG